MMVDAWLILRGAPTPGGAPTRIDEGAPTLVDGVVINLFWGGCMDDTEGCSNTWGCSNPYR